MLLSVCEDLTDDFSLVYVHVNVMNDFGSGSENYLCVFGMF